MRIQLRKLNRVQAVLFLCIPLLIFILGIFAGGRFFVNQARAAAANLPEPALQAYMPPPIPPTPPPSGNKSNRQGAITRKSTAKSNTKPSKILDLPFPEHLECVNQSGPVCGVVQQTCPLISDPVYDKDGKFYPSPCWAEVYGVTEYQKGNSVQLQKFIRDLWYAPKSSPISQSAHDHGYLGPKDVDSSVELNVPSPNIEFTYSDPEFGKGPALRSRIWQGNTAFTDLIYYFSDQSTMFIRRNRLWPVTGRKKALLVFLNFSKAFPEKTLLDFSQIYAAALNDYYKHNQNIADPIEYDFTPVVIDPPAGVTEQGMIPYPGATLTANDIHAEKIYKATLDKLQLSAPQNFDMLAWVPITDTAYNPAATYGGGRPGLAMRKLGAGKMSWLWSGLFSQGRSLSPDKPLADDMLFFENQFNSMFIALSHEILHGLGMLHSDLEQGTRDLIQNQPQTISVGEQPRVMFSCDNLGKYLEQSAAEAIKLPPEFGIQVGNEPAGQIVPSQSGACLYPNNGPSFKDVDKDGTYELVYLPENIGEILKDLEGWTDTDGDGIAEIVDPTPYGGLKILNPPRLEYGRPLGPASFAPIKEVRINNCRFEKIKLSTGQTGLLPLSCPEFDSIRTDVYKGLQYYWTTVKKSYGLVLIAKQ